MGQMLFQLEIRTETAYKIKHFSMPKDLSECINFHSSDFDELTRCTRQTQMYMYTLCGIALQMLFVTCKMQAVSQAHDLQVN